MTKNGESGVIKKADRSQCGFLHDFLVKVRRRSLLPRLRPTPLSGVISTVCVSPLRGLHGTAAP